MSKFAYIRMVLIGQAGNGALQAMIAEGIEERNIFTDRLQNKNSKCPGYGRMLKKLKPGDTVFIPDIGCLGNSYDDIIAQWRTITEKKKADIVVMDFPMLDTRKGKELVGSLISDTVLAALKSVADNERRKKDAIHKKNAEAISAAKEKGVRFGAPEIPVPENFNQVVDLWQSGEISLREAAKKCNMPKSTFYDKARKLLGRDLWVDKLPRP